jgi:hypothetical protein
MGIVLKNVNITGGKLSSTIDAPSGWVRNPDWLPLPEITAADNRFVGLFLVFENGYNFTTFTLNGTSLNVDVDFGDGTTENIIWASGNQTRAHIYNYSTISSPVSVYKDGRNYKQVIVDIKVNSGTLTNFNPVVVTTINGGGVNQFADINYAFPNAATMILSSPNRRMLLLERLNILSHSVTAAASFGLSTTYSLRKLIFNLNTINSLASQFTSAGNPEPFDIISTNITSLATTFNGNSQIQRIGNVDCPNVTTWNQFAINATSLVQVGDVSLPVSTVNNNVFQGCVMLQKTGTINIPAATAIDGFFNVCRSLKEAHFTDLSLVTSATNLFTACNSLERATLTGLRIGVSVNGTAMLADGLNAMMTSMGTANGSQTLDLRNTPGAATCDTTIATAKGYTVTII